MFDLNNFVIDHVLRGYMSSTADGSYMWSINQITDPSLSITSETADAVDAMGSTITTFNRGKQAEFTANNSLFDLGLYAAQLGTEKQVADSANKIKVPAFETIDVPADTVAGTPTNVTLAHTPIGALTEIHELKGDGTMGTKYIAGTAASDTEFVISDRTLTLPNGLSKGSQLFVVYEYESESAVKVTGNAVDFPKSGKFIMEVLGTDVCDPTTLIHAYVVFPNAKLDANVDISFTTDGAHPFTIRANQDYCDAEKPLFHIVVPEEA